jgi:hypothetical protein
MDAAQRALFDAAVRELLRRSQAGDVRAAMLLLDFMYGTPPLAPRAVAP